MTNSIRTAAGSGTPFSSSSFSQAGDLNISTSGTPSTGTSSGVQGETRLNVEFLKVSTLLLEHCPSNFKLFKKDIIKFAWNHIKADDVTTKHWAYVNICRFVVSFDSPPKIITQVYVALLRSYQPDGKELIRLALDTLVPVLPARLSSDEFSKVMKWTKKILIEESHSLPQLCHIWHVIVRFSDVFYSHRSHLVPHMVNTISRLGLPPNCLIEYRQIAVAVADVIIRWEGQSYKNRSRATAANNHRGADTNPTRATDATTENILFPPAPSSASSAPQPGKRTLSPTLQRESSKRFKDETGSHSSSGSGSGTNGGRRSSSFSESNGGSSSSSSGNHHHSAERDEEFSMQAPMLQIVANFLVRLSLFAADNKDVGIVRLVPRCLMSYRRMVSSLSMNAVTMPYFERLLQGALDNYAANAGGLGGGGLSQLQLQQGGGLGSGGASSGSSKSTGSSSGGGRGGAGSAAGSAGVGVSGQPGAGALPGQQGNFNANNASMQRMNPQANSSNIPTVPANPPIADAVLTTFIHLLTISLDSIDNSFKLLEKHASQVRDLLTPIFATETSTVKKAFLMFLTKVKAVTIRWLHLMKYL
jgi:uncharacterized membrane protein YgcG